ncbi:tigger transposable element-derived protein 1-like [Onthophagus taurus]|uniref:tigger transposable element-derived protein 1-like n=1 Tax=Onthophagus taurus TaxID=166361 RepID=UPI0039BE85D7
MRFNDFKANKGWFDRFRKRCGIHSIVRHGEAASANREEAERFKIEFAKFVEDNGFLPQQIFNCDETGLFWKKLPNRTYVTQETSRLLGHKPMKDRVTLLLGANSSGDMKLKPMFVYHSANHRVFKIEKVDKESLGVYWQFNKKA